MFNERTTESTAATQAREQRVTPAPVAAEASVANSAAETREGQRGKLPAGATPDRVAQLLPDIAATVRAGLTVPTPRKRSVLDAGDAYPAIDPSLLADYQASGRRLQAQVLGEAFGSGLAWLRDAIATPSPAAAKRSRSALDAGGAYPAIDPDRVAVQQLRSRRLQARATGDLIAAGLRKSGGALAAAARWAFTPAPATLDVERLRAYGWSGALDVPPNYQQRASLFYGRSL